MNKLLLKDQIVKAYGDSIPFQILEWYVNDLYDEDNEMTTCRVNLFGRTAKGHSVTLTVNGFQPSFYIQVPDNWKTTNKTMLVNELNDKLRGAVAVDSCKLVKRKIFYGYRGDKLDKFIHLCFLELKTFYYARKIFTNKFKVGNEYIQFKMFEEKVDPILQAIHNLSFPSVGWIQFDYNKGEKTSNSTSQIEYTLDKEYVTLYNNNEVPIAPFLQMSYDIECFSNDPTKFPTPDIAANSIIQIGMSFKTFGNENVTQILLTLKDSSPLSDKDAILYCFKKEKDLLLKFKDIVNDYNPDIIYSYNGHRFDDSYLYSRAKLLNIEDKLMTMSRFKDIPGKLNTKSFSSGAYGTSNWEIMDLPGRINFDLYVYINREYKLDSYKMDAVAEHFLSEEIKNVVDIEGEKIYLNDKDISKCHKGSLISIADSLSSESCGKIIDIYKGIGKDDRSYIITEREQEEERDISDITINLSVQKNPMGPQNIFAFYKEGKPDKIKDIAEYCLMDTFIPLHLNDKLNIFLNQIGMATVTHVPFKFLIERGQQIKVYSQLLKETKKRKYLIPTTEVYKADFEGATVLTPTSGFFDCPVVVLDFASLYPSIIRAHNLCYSTLVMDTQYLGLPGVDYKEVAWEDEKGSYSYSYVQNVPSVLPDLLKDLIEERTRIRKQMKGEPDPFKVMVMNGFQLALKVSANSIYGFLSAQMLQCTAIGACTTALGRQMIKDTKEYVDNNYTDFKTIYGDSVTGDTALTLKNRKGELVVKSIEDLFKEGMNLGHKYYPEFKIGNPMLHHDTKEQVPCAEYKTMSSNGFSTIRRVIRHKTRNKLYRITTKSGVVTVTGDHSLLDGDGNIIKAKDCIVGETKLLQFRTI
jgi:DNA polymerase elongation subunit (family B)